MEEFQEADVLWPDHHDGRQQQQHAKKPHASAAQQRGGACPVSSAPVGIPRTVGAASWTRGYDDGAAEGFVPPHVLAARRRCSEEERVASSVCVGHGRTLKGRDLRYVRTAVLRMTGFLES